MIREPQQPNSATLDHIVPRAHGGTNIRANLVVACRRCNTTRNTTVAHFG
jgi:5-methylcytosine-specific restriction endonuclease McrA